MIGNDIIDLEAASVQSNWQRPGFLDKLFHYQEQQLILQSSQPQVQVWMLWAMKEAAYKAHQREFQLSRRFNPKMLVCAIDHMEISAASGNVQIAQYTYKAQIGIYKDHLHCVATNLPPSQVVSNILPSSENIKQALLLKVAAIKPPLKHPLRMIKDTNKVPQICGGDQDQPWYFSLSHHGKYAAYSLALINY